MASNDLSLEEWAAVLHLAAFHAHPGPGRDDLHSNTAISGSRSLGGWGARYPFHHVQLDDPCSTRPVAVAAVARVSPEAEGDALVRAAPIVPVIMPHERSSNVAHGHEGVKQP